MKNKFEFMSGITLGGELFYNRYELMIDFYSLGDTPTNQNLALDRLTYFIYDVVGRAAFIPEGDDALVAKYAAAGIPVLTSPGPAPVDPLLLAMLATKMNAIMENVLILDAAELSSQVGGGVIYTWDPADDSDEVHKFVNETDEAKWWASSEPRFVSYSEGTKVAKYEVDNPYPMTWESLDLEWETDEPEPKPRKKGKDDGTIIKADFT